MADWVHCNSCFHLPNSGRKFALTNCGHIYCENCVASGTRQKCQMCGVPCTTIFLSSKMKPDVELFFTDPVQIVKKQQKQLIQVMDFQRNHRSRLSSFNREKASKQDSIIQKAQKAMQQLSDLERQVMVLREENSYLKALNSRGGGGGGGAGGTGGATVGRTSSAPRRSPVNIPTGSTPPGSAHRYRGSPAGSQLSQNHLSHNNRESTPVHGSHHVTSGRLSVRTPPIHGQLGVVHGTPSPGGTVYTAASNLSGSSQPPGGRGGTSPMQCSPAHRHSNIPNLPTMVMPITPKTPGGTVLPPPASSPMNSATPNACSQPAQSSGHYAQSGGHYAQSGGHYAQSGGHYAQSGGHYAQSGGHYAQSGGHYAHTSGQHGQGDGDQSTSRRLIQVNYPPLPSFRNS